MDFNNRNNGDKKFVCPSDRQLALRAKLKTGWSSSKANEPLRPEEQAAIISVIRRNEEVEIAERQRVGRLVERVERIKQRAVNTSGPNCCRLCGDSFRLLRPTRIFCEDCKKAVCAKCSVDINIRYHTNTKFREIWLCRICAETREMWKKSGAWFFKGLPNYELPSSTKSATTRTNTAAPIDDNISQRKAQSGSATPDKKVRIKKLTIRVNDSSSSSDEEQQGIFDGTKLKSMAISDTQGNPLQRHESLPMHNVCSFRSFIDAAAGDRKASNNSLNLNSKTSKLSSSPQEDLDTVSTDSTVDTALSKTHRDGGSVRRGSVSSSWSISDSSSAASANVFCNTNLQNCRDPLLGWLEVAVSYRENYNTLDCTVVRARDLPPMDAAGLTDPFCKLNIITPEGHTKYTRWQRTKTVHKTRNPEFNEIVQFVGIEIEELGNSLLYIVIFDDDKYGHDFLGLAQVCLSTVHNSNQHRICVPLGVENQYSNEAVLSERWDHGKILISLCYNTKKRALVVKVRECLNLISMDNNGSSDPFVKLQLKPDAHKNKKHKTSVKWRTLNPTFNEEFIFDASPQDLNKESLIITVWDKDIGKSNDFLGGLLVGYSSKGERLQQWLNCIRLPDQFHEKWHCLSAENPAH